MTTIFLSSERDPWMVGIDERSVNQHSKRGVPLAGRIAFADASLRAELARQKLEIRDYPPIEFVNELLSDTEQLLDCTPSLREAVYACVEEIFLLQAPSDDYDINHSEPRWKSRIFISIPGPSPKARLRIAEAIVHEAMHLNLTNVENSTALVKSSNHLYSPWKIEFRSVGGVLHGLYVFACVYRFLRYVVETRSADAIQSAYIENRLSEIRIEVEAVPRMALLDSLTSAGRAVAELAFEVVES